MRLIDADNLNRKKKYSFETVHGIFPKNEWFLKLEDLHKAPTVDAVPVVRCRECEHWKDWGACGHPDNGWDAPPMGPEDFCSRGERR